MADEWCDILFGDVCEHSAFGPRFSGEMYAADGNVATLRTTDISEDGRIDLEGMPLADLDLTKLQQHVLRLGDLVITRTGRVGSTAVFQGYRLPVLPGAFLIRFRLKRLEAEPNYFRYYFMSPYGQQQIQSVATGSVQKNLNITNLHRLPMRVPPLREQQAIACILGALDDKIELNRRRNRTLEAMARAIFQSWFVDFDPVKAKAAGRTPPGLSPALAALFPDSFTDSPLGPIPTGWRVGTLDEVAKNPRRGIAANEIKLGTPYIALEHMPRRSIALTDWITADEIESNKFEFHRGEILFGKLRPYFHKVGIAPVNGVCSTDILVIVPKGADWLGFCAGHFSSDAIIQHADRASTGTKMPRTNWSDLARFQVIIPASNVAGTFTMQFKPMIGSIHQAIDESRTLAALRDALLPKLISGELRVPDAERIVGRIT